MSLEDADKALAGLTGIDSEELQKFLEEKAGIAPDEEAQGTVMAAAASIAFPVAGPGPTARDSRLLQGPGGGWSRSGTARSGEGGDHAAACVGSGRHGELRAAVHAAPRGAGEARGRHGRHAPLPATCRCPGRRAGGAAAGRRSRRAVPRLARRDARGHRYRHGRGGEPGVRRPPALLFARTTARDRDGECDRSPRPHGRAAGRPIRLALTPRHTFRLRSVR
ncbi:thioviridamide family RiPP peptide [Planosporangium thailandense]|uniref:Thioviridamide family RiPP peptide n=1 Tax=Planosporangium thailandense TaxID=765197 RepID=A0ABX0Y0P8_9ACTN|nr:thioviridamide family RiPP peptide [Planosporangium thailandense]